jgi:hypothetical protein
MRRIAPWRVATFRAAVDARDHAAVVRLLADDVVLHSPIAFEPFRSRAVVRRLLGVLINEVFDDFASTDELTGGVDVHALVFRTRVGEMEVEGLDLLRFDADGSIAELTVMVRPLRAALALRDAIALYDADIVG